MGLLLSRQELIRGLAECRNASERLTWLVDRARRQPPLGAQERQDAHLVPGCLSKLWVVPEFAGGRCHFRCDSESQVVRGLAGFLCELASGCTPAELLEAGPGLPSGLGLDRFLSPNRRAAQARAWERILAFAASRLTPAEASATSLPNAPLRRP